MARIVIGSWNIKKHNPEQYNDPQFTNEIREHLSAMYWLAVGNQKKLWESGLNITEGSKGVNPLYIFKNKLCSDKSIISLNQSSSSSSASSFSKEREATVETIYRKLKDLKLTDSEINNILLTLHVADHEKILEYLEALENDDDGWFTHINKIADEQLKKQLEKIEKAKSARSGSFRARRKKVQMMHAQNVNSLLDETALVLIIYETKKGGKKIIDAVIKTAKDTEWGSMPLGCEAVYLDGGPNTREYVLVLYTKHNNDVGFINASQINILEGLNNMNKNQFSIIEEEFDNNLNRRNQNMQSRATTNYFNSSPNSKMKIKNDAVSKQANKQNVKDPKWHRKPAKIVIKNPFNGEIIIHAWHLPGPDISDTDENAVHYCNLVDKTAEEGSAHLIVGDLNIRTVESHLRGKKYDIKALNDGTTYKTDGSVSKNTRDYIIETKRGTDELAGYSQGYKISSRTGINASDHVLLVSMYDTNYPLTDINAK